MAVIRGATSPTFKDFVRKLAGDDDGGVILDRVDIVSKQLLDNIIAVKNMIGSGGGTASIVTTGDASYDITDDDYTILADGSSNTVDVNLPTAVGREGVIFVIKAIDVTNAVTVNAQAGEEIDGNADFTFASQYDAITVQSDNANWWVI